MVFLYNAVSYLLYPYTLLCILMTFVLITTQRRLLLFIACASLYIMSSGVSVGWLLDSLPHYQRVSVDLIARYRTLILLGSGLSSAEGEQYPGLFAYSRLLEAKRIYYQAQQLGIDYQIIVSGGDPGKHGISEAKVYKQWLVQMGLPGTAILEENQSRNTFENAKYTSQLIKGRSDEGYLLVTGHTHMQRALSYFKYFGIAVQPAVSDTVQTSRNLLPRVTNLMLSNTLIHEKIGLGRLYWYNLWGVQKSPV